MPRRLIAFAAVLAAVGGSSPAALAGPADAPVASAAARAYTTTLKDSFFSPSTITVKSRRATVKFVWRGRLAHNLVGKSIPRKYARARVRHKSLKRTYGRGVYRFQCTIHPGMDFKLRVRR